MYLKRLVTIVSIRLSVERMDDMKYIWQFNCDVFKDTRNKSNTIYSEDTDKLLENTLVYSDANEILTDDVVINNDMKIKVIHGGTVSTAYELKKDNNHVAILNFADAKRPGGWVIEGAPTQEENICRCTNLYETLIQPRCLIDYYQFNKDNGIADAEQHYDEAYTNAMIYAKDVAIFKDDVNYDDIPVKHVDVITSPAPCGVVDNVEMILKDRMRGIIKAAYFNNVTHIILGAWGCGAFGQSPRIVARCFAEVLKELPVFDTVIFAIRCTVGLEYKDVTFKVFEKQFRKPLF